jgi:hypothetical protein
MDIQSELFKNEIYMLFTLSIITLFSVLILIILLVFKIIWTEYNLLIYNSKKNLSTYKTYNSLESIIV